MSRTPRSSHLSLVLTAHATHTSPRYSQRHRHGDEERLGGRVLAAAVDLLPVRERRAAALVTRLPRSALDAVHQPEVQLEIGQRGW